MKPDGIYSAGILEIKDWLKLSRVRQIRGEAWLVSSKGSKAGKNFVLMCTNRAKEVAGPLKFLIKEKPNHFLFRRHVNSDTYDEWIFGNDPLKPLAGSWVPTTKSRGNSSAIFHARTLTEPDLRPG